MPSHLSTPKLTYQDLLRLPEDLFRHELIEGEHYLSPAPAPKHQRVVVHLARILSSFVLAEGLGEILVAPVDVVFSEFDVVEPDLLFISAERASRVQERYIAGAPDLVVEVLSPSTRGLDRLKKRRLYEENGVREYWIFDPAQEAAEVYRIDGRRFSRALPLSSAAGDLLASPLLPGLYISLEEVFAPPRSPARA
jgi:Uma2 family endonuclease